MWTPDMKLPQGGEVDMSVGMVLVDRRLLGWVVEIITNEAPVTTNTIAVLRTLHDITQQPSPEFRVPEGYQLITAAEYKALQAEIFNLSDCLKRK